MTDKERPLRWGLQAALVMTALLVVAIMGQAGSPEDPELQDPVGDVHLEGEIPLPEGFAWADIRALWYQEPDLGEVTMHISLLDAPMIPPPGEVSAHIQVDQDHWVTGFTTVLFPFAIPYYQGGFYCPATADREVDPEECEVLPDVALLEDAIQVPLPPEVFGIEPGSTIRTHMVASSAWYFSVSTTLDETERGRPFNVSSPGEADPSTPEPEDEPGRSTSGQAQKNNQSAPEEELEEAHLGGTILLLAIGLAVLGLVRRRVGPAE